ncbi:MAG: hypothetical protein HY686_05670 [Chloroflexi bacterium]|nr:hypothetical protein [Chloroflexota bacterium]
MKLRSPCCRPQRLPQPALARLPPSSGSGQGKDFGLRLLGAPTLAQAVRLGLAQGKGRVQQGG